MLSLRGVVAGYGGGNVLQGVDLTVIQGSITCIVGPNGAGKSTVLRTISGLLSPSAGTIDLLGKPIHRLNCNSILSEGIVQLPQHDALFPSMTIRENVMMGGYLIRRKRSLVTERYDYVESLIPFVKERPHDKAGNLSGGQRRMVEIGRTLMLDPSLILMDEPSLGLDPKAVTQVWDLIRLFAEQQRTILLVEQNVRLGFKVATHGVIMEGGKVRREGEPGALLADPDMAALYLGGTTQGAAQTSNKESTDGRQSS